MFGNLLYTFLFAGGWGQKRFLARVRTGSTRRPAPRRASSARRSDGADAGNHDGALYIDRGGAEINSRDVTGGA